jgi:hypothetical protein
LEEALHQIKKTEAVLQLRIKDERVYREKSCVVDGELSLSEGDMRIFKEIQKEINSLFSPIKKIEKTDEKRFSSLKKKKAELARIIDRKKFDRVDVELEKKMTGFKISFANICCYLLAKCFNGENMTLQRLFDTIFASQRQMRTEDGQRKIDIERNSKQNDIMRKLENAF